MSIFLQRCLRMERFRRLLLLLTNICSLSFLPGVAKLGSVSSTSILLLKMFVFLSSDLPKIFDLPKFVEMLPISYSSGCCFLLVVGFLCAYSSVVMVILPSTLMSGMILEGSKTSEIISFLMFICRPQESKKSFGDKTLINKLWYLIFVLDELFHPLNLIKLPFEFNVVTHQQTHFLLGCVLEHFQGLVHHFVYFFFDFGAFPVDVLESVLDYVHRLHQKLFLLVKMDIYLFEHFPCLHIPFGDSDKGMHKKFT